MTRCELVSIFPLFPPSEVKVTVDGRTVLCRGAISRLALRLNVSNQRVSDAVRNGGVRADTLARWTAILAGSRAADAAT